MDHRTPDGIRRWSARAPSSTAWSRWTSCLWDLHARGEYEYVGHKILDAANSQDGWKQLEAIPVGETRLALVRTFLDGRLEVGANGMIARGYTGQTTETIASIGLGRAVAGGRWDSVLHSRFRAERHFK